MMNVGIPKKPVTAEKPAHTNQAQPRTQNFSPVRSGPDSESFGQLAATCVFEVGGAIVESCCSPAACAVEVVADLAVAVISGIAEL